MIFVECNPDKTLVSTTGISHKEIEHAYGKGNVCNKLKKNRNSKGLVDEDPLSIPPNYIGKLKLLLQEHNIKLLYDEKTQNYLIMLCPNLEEWILKMAEEAEVDVKDYYLPDNADKLHQFVSVNEMNKDFKNLIEDLKGKSKIFKTLENLLKK